MLPHRPEECYYKFHIATTIKCTLNGTLINKCRFLHLYGLFISGEESKSELSSDICIRFRSSSQIPCFCKSRFGTHSLLSSKAAGTGSKTTHTILIFTRYYPEAFKSAYWQWFRGDERREATTPWKVSRNINNRGPVVFHSIICYHARSTRSNAVVSSCVEVTDESWGWSNKQAGKLVRFRRFALFHGVGQSVVRGPEGPF